MTVRPFIQEQREDEMSEATNKQVVLDCWDAANKHDVSKLDKFYAEDVVYHGTDGEIRGRENVKAFLSAYMTALPDLKLTVDDIFGEGDRVFSRVRLEGTHTGPFRQVPPTGKRLELRWVMNVARMENGRIAEEWEICDQMDIMSQLGLLEATPA
jgi:steroid delta-isomerase-like uncharacterized protein